MDQRELREAIRRGEYSVDVHRVAEAMIDRCRLVLSRSRVLVPPQATEPRPAGACEGDPVSVEGAA